MKRNSTKSATRPYGLGSSITLMTLVAVLGWVGTARAQDFSGIRTQDINGIFYPRSSEDFFEEGRERLEAEIEQLQETARRPADETPLEIDESIEQQRDVLERGDDSQFPSVPVDVPREG